MPKAKRSVEEIKQDLKQEIIRLGIQDNPSRTVYQKEYQRGVAPSPNGALKATGMKWQELMRELGFDYDGKKNSLVAARSESSRLNMRREKGLRLTDSDNLKYVVDEALKLMHDEKIIDAATFERVVNARIDTTYQNMVKHGFSFEKFKDLYAEKYGREIRRGKWRDKNNSDLLGIAVGYMKENDITSLAQYDKSIDKNEFPSIWVLMEHLDLTYAELSKHVINMLK